MSTQVTGGRRTIVVMAVVTVLSIVPERVDSSQATGRLMNASFFVMK